jgi:hypothetical protein
MTVGSRKVVRCRNVAIATKKSARLAGISSGSSQRLLSLELTDGQTICRAVELQTIAELSTVTPGSKVVLRRCSVNNRWLLLTPESVRVLGGKVPALYAGVMLRMLLFVGLFEIAVYEMEQQAACKDDKIERVYGDDEEHPPPFTLPPLITMSSDASAMPGVTVSALPATNMTALTPPVGSTASTPSTSSSTMSASTTTSEVILHTRARGGARSKSTFTAPYVPKPVVVLHDTQLHETRTHDAHAMQHTVSVAASPQSSETRASDSVDGVTVTSSDTLLPAARARKPERGVYRARGRGK